MIFADKPKKIAIVIVTYNANELLPIQLKCIKKYCQDDKYDIIVIDNSDIPHHVSYIMADCITNNVIYKKYESSTKDNSKSHAEAANYAYRLFKNTYEYFFYLDHDCFPIQNFGIEEMLYLDVAAGIIQVRGNIIYLWPGCLMFNNNILEDCIDFSPNETLSLDTGGNLYKVVNNNSNIYYLDEENVEIIEEGFKTNYSLIYDKTFMHFIKGSNWNKNPNHIKRMEILMTILKEKIL